MLAQLPDPNHFASIGWVTVILVAIIVGLNQGIALVKSMKDKPSPLDVASESASKFVSKSECHLLHVASNDRLTRVENDLAEIRKSIDGWNATAERRASDIHARIDPIARELAGVKYIVEIIARKLGCSAFEN